MELDYTTLSDQQLAKALAANHVAIQNYWTQISELADGSGKAINELIVLLVKNIEWLEGEGKDLRKEASRRERFRSA